MHSSLQFDVVDLARSQAAKFEHQHWFLVAIRPIARQVLTIPVSVASNFASGFIERLAKKMTTQAVVFRGMRVGLIEQQKAFELDPNDEVRALIDKMEKDILELRGGMFNLAQARKKLGRPDGRFSTGLISLQSAISELFDEVRSFKGALQSHDANVCSILATVVKPLTADADIDAAFSRMMSEK